MLSYYLLCLNKNPQFFFLIMNRFFKNTCLPIPITSLSIQRKLFIHRNLIPLLQFQHSSNFSKKMSNERSEEEWRAILSPEQFRIIRQKGTEPAGSGEYNKFKEQGMYNCAACNTPLYVSDTKFDSGCGWPAFFEAIPGAVNRHEDNSFGMKRTEITCAACGGHLGHVFKGEGWKHTPADERHCVNSISLKFSPENKE